MKNGLRLLMTADAAGGVWTYCCELASALREYGVEISLAVMGDPPTRTQRAQFQELENVRLFENCARLEWMDDPWSDVDAAGAWLLEIAEQARPDVVHLNGYAHAALPWNLPVVVVAHSCVCSWWRAVKGEPVPLRLAEYHRRVEEGLRRADLVVAPSFAMQAALRENYHFYAPEQVIPNARSADSFSSGKKEAFIFSAGRVWDEAKNLRLLERIAPSLRWPVLLAGANNPESDDETSPVVRLGQLEQDELAARLTSAAIYAAPARYEPFGLGVLEAALSGCALVLGDIPSLRENWKGAAIFLPPEDDAQWRDALNALATEPERRADLAARAGRRAARFSTEVMAAAYFGAYCELVKTACVAGRLQESAA